MPKEPSIAARPNPGMPRQENPGQIQATPDPIRPGGACPRCGTGKLDYNGLLDLECTLCGYVISSGGGCT